MNRSNGLGGAEVGGGGRAAMFEDFQLFVCVARGRAQLPAIFHCTFHSPPFRDTFLPANSQVFVSLDPKRFSYLLGSHPKVFRFSYLSVSLDPKRFSYLLGSHPKDFRIFWLLAGGEVLFLKSNLP